jgi:hypothetical protein
MTTWCGPLPFALALAGFDAVHAPVLSGGSMTLALPALPGIPAAAPAAPVPATVVPLPAAGPVGPLCAAEPAPAAPGCLSPPMGLGPLPLMAPRPPVALLIEPRPATVVGVFVPAPPLVTLEVPAVLAPAPPEPPNVSPCDIAPVLPSDPHAMESDVAAVSDIATALDCQCMRDTFRSVLTRSGACSRLELSAQPSASSETAP